MADNIASLAGPDRGRSCGYRGDGAQTRRARFRSRDQDYLLPAGLPYFDMLLMEQAGMTPMQVIVAGTGNAARVCRRERDFGTLTPGKLADILVVRGDPLKDLKALNNVLLVLREGVIIRKES